MPDSPGHPLDDPVGTALTGPHAHLAEHHGDARRYPPEVSPFAAPTGWADLARVVGPAGVATFTGTDLEFPDGWEPAWELPGVQMVGDGVVATDDAEAVVLGPADVDEMLDLVARTRPGPFGRRTIELGRYRGLRRGGALVAMAGERLRPPGWTEISAVCTDPAHRNQGLGARLIRAVAAGIRERGDTPFLHTVADNTTAIRLYEHLGFRLRARPSFYGVRPAGNTEGVPGTEHDEHPTGITSGTARSAHP